MLKWLLKSLLVIVVFVPFAAALPLASVSLCRTLDGAMFLFWTGPWSCCFWVLLYSQLSAAPWRQGAEAVRQWREANGGLLVKSVKATVWMFGALFLSYLAEFLLLFADRSAASNRAWLPVATYSPLALVWAWRRLHG
jgi:hypothetical protein